MIDAIWQLLVALLIVAGLMHQMRSSASLPFLLRVLIWPVLWMEGTLAALSLARSTSQPEQSIKAKCKDGEAPAAADDGTGAEPRNSTDATRDAPAARSTSPARARPKTE